MYNRLRIKCERRISISSLHKGHRQRVKKEFLENGLGHFPDHKVLEMLLYYTIPRSDTNEIGHRLLKKFGSFTGVFDAPMELLMETKGVGQESATLIKFVSQLIGKYMDDYTYTDNIIDTVDAAKDYMAHKFLGQTVEIIYIACLAPNGKVIYSSQLAEGSPEAVGIRPVDIVKMALRTDAVQVVLGHNHPYGISIPSNADLSTTSVLYHELKRVEIKLFDHIIVGNDGVYSLRENGMMPRE